VVTPKQIEIALHEWKPWGESIITARQMLGFRPNFSKDELKVWEKNEGWENVRQVVVKVLQDLVLPPSFAPYWMACFYSDYDPQKPATYSHIRLPQRAHAWTTAERQPGAVLVRLVGTKAYKLDQSGKVNIDTSDPERILPPYPVEMLIPSIGPVGFGMLNNPSEASEVIPIIRLPFAVAHTFAPTSDTTPSPHITVRIPLFAPSPNWRWLRMEFDAIEKWLKVVGEHPLRVALRGKRRERFYWKEQAMEKLANALNKKAAIHEVEEIELVRELARISHPSKAEERKIRTRVRKRVAVWAKEAGIS
jgi:hypothetical protein